MYLGIDRGVDGAIIAADKFVHHFSKCYSCNNEKQQQILKMNMTVCEQIIPDFRRKSTLSLMQKLVSKVISELKRGEADDIDGLTSHSILPVIMARFFQIVFQMHTVCP